MLRRFYLLKRFPFIYKTQSHQETLVALCKDYNALTCQQTENEAIRLRQELESFFCFTSINVFSLMRGLHFIVLFLCFLIGAVGT